LRMICSGVCLRRAMTILSGPPKNGRTNRTTQTADLNQGVTSHVDLFAKILRFRRISPSRWDLSPQLVERDRVYFQGLSSLAPSQSGQQRGFVKDRHKPIGCQSGEFS